MPDHGKGGWAEGGRGTEGGGNRPIADDSQFVSAMPPWHPAAWIFHNNSMAKRSNYQDRIIRNYYQNRDTIMLQRLGELVTDLFLAEGKTKARLWKRVGEILEKLKVPKSQIQHLVRSDNPTLVANLLKKLLEESG